MVNIDVLCVCPSRAVVRALPSAARGRAATVLLDIGTITGEDDFSSIASTRGILSVLTRAVCVPETLTLAECSSGERDHASSQSENPEALQ